MTTIWIVRKRLDYGCYDCPGVDGSPIRHFSNEAAAEEFRNTYIAHSGDDPDEVVVESQELLDVAPTRFEYSIARFFRAYDTTGFAAIMQKRTIDRRDVVHRSIWSDKQSLVAWGIKERRGEGKILEVRCVGHTDSEAGLMLDNWLSENGIECPR